MTLKSKILTNKTKILNFSSKKIGVFILESRSWSKKTISSFFKETINLHVVISFLLFIFGVFMPIKVRYGDQFVSFFFKNNLPAVSIPYSQISWETFEYLISNYFDLDKNILNQNTKIKNVLPLSGKIEDFEREISKSQFLENKKNKTFRSPSIQSIDRVNLEDFKTSIAREQLPISTSSILDEDKQNKLNNKIIDSEKSKFQTKFLKNINFSFIEKDPTIERVDLYNDSILIQTNSIWNQQQKQNYIGFFPKKNSSLVQNIKDNDWMVIHNPVNIKNVKLNEDLKIENYNTSPFHEFVFGKKWYSISNRNITLPFLSKTSEINKIFIDKTFSPNNKLVDSTNWRQNFLSNLDELPLKLDTGFFEKNVNRSEIENLIPINHKLQLLPIYQLNKKTLNGLEFSNKLKIPFSFSKFQNKILDDQKNIKWSEPLNKINDQLLACKKHTPNVNKSMTITNTKQSRQNSDIKSFQIEDFTGQQNKELTPVEGCKIENFNKENTPNKIKNLELTNYEGLQGIENLNQMEDLHNSKSKKLVNNNLTKLNFLQRELKLLFDNQKILPFNNFKLTKKIFQQPRLMSGYRYPDMNKNDIYEYKLNTLYKTKLAQFLKLQKQSPILESNNVIKIWLPPSLVSESKYNLSTLELNSVPSFQLKYRSTLLEDTEKNQQPIYDGPGISLNSITKDVHLLNQKKVLKWTSKYLAFDNPLTDRKINFLGLESTTESSDTESSVPGTDFSESVEEKFTKNSMFPDRLFTNQKKFYFISKINKQNFTQQPDPSVIPTKINKKVAFLKEKEWYDILEIMKPKWEKAKAEQNLESEKDPEIDIVLPFITMFQPTGKKIVWPLTDLDYQSSQLPKFETDLNTYFNESLKPKNFEIDFNKSKISSINKSVLDTSTESSLPHVFKIKNFNAKPFKIKILIPSTGFSNSRFSKIINHSFPFSKTLLQRNIIENTNLNAIYQRIPTIFNAKQSNIFTDPHNRFRDSWEPLTTEPLSILTQIYFALFCLKILQSYYKKYGKEVLSYIINIIELLGILDDNLKDELQLSNNEDFRLIKKTEKRFKDIAGIEKILPELSEIVWLLRNKKLNLFKLRGSIIPKGILLVGPPGTGKTLLVQAIAGEAEVPVLVQSGSSLIDPEKSENGTDKLKHMFDRARELAPCILFIDEIDTLGQQRQNVMQNPMGADELMESLHKGSINSRYTTSLETNFSGDRGNKISKFLNENEFLPETSNENREFLPKSRNNSLGKNSSTTLSIAEQSLQEEQTRQAITHERLSLLMQFLVEMDGLSPRQGVVVIGATNRPAVLDRAFTRPGRFDQILHLAFPGKEKRIEILKLYSQNLGIDKNVSWDYFGNRTEGFSAADLSAIMNQSSIQAILQETIHSIDTIEHGIDFITSYGIEKPTMESYSKLLSNGQKYKDPFFVSRLAYYQAGKAILYTMLPEHPPAIVLHFWPYSKKIRKNSHQFLLKNYRRVELETQMIGLYAGKAAEILALCGSSLFFSKNKKTTNINCYKLDRNFSKSKIFQRKLWDSDLGNADLRIASSLGYSMVNNWFLYSKKISIRKENQIITNQNTREIREIELFRFLNKLAENDENQLKDVKEAATFKKPDTLNKKDEPVLRLEDYQKWSFSPWWQYQVTNQIYLVPPTENDWYRIFLPDPQQTERNDEWMPPDQYWHNKENFSNLLSSSLELKNKNMKKLTVKPKKKTVCDETFQKNDQYNVLTALKSSILSGKSKNSYGKTTSFVTWNNLYKLDRDYIYHSLVMLCFNKAFCLLEENRELLDYFAYYLIRFKTIRQNDIITIFSKFGLSVLAKQELIPDSFNKNIKNVNESGTINLSACFKITKVKPNKES